MASIFSHAFVAVTVGKTFPGSLLSQRVLWLGILCAILPDADVLTFGFGIPYSDFWGHRGFSHSLLFAAFVAILITAFFFKETKISSLYWWRLTSYFFICTASHGVLDALTDGGLGVAFFSPLDNTRYFFPWQPIQVSPIGILNFFSMWGVHVVISELLWVGLPGLLFIVLFGRRKMVRQT